MRYLLFLVLQSTRLLPIRSLAQLHLIRSPMCTVLFWSVELGYYGKLLPGRAISSINSNIIYHQMFDERSEEGYNLRKVTPIP